MTISAAQANKVDHKVPQNYVKSFFLFGSIVSIFRENI